MTDQLESKKSAKKLLSTIVKILLTVTAFYILYKKVDLNQVLDLMKNINPLFYILAVLSFLVSKIISAFRLNAYYRSQGLYITEIENTKIYYHAMFYNIIIPLIGGEASKIIWIKNNYNVATKSLVWSALLDRGGGLVALVILTVILYYFTSVSFPFSDWLFILIPLALIGSYLLHHLFFKTYKPAWLKVNILSIAVQLLQLSAAYFVVKSMNLDSLVIEYLFIFMLSSFAYMLPFIGARELAFVYGAEVIGLNEEISLTISLLFYTVIVINSLLGGIFFIFPIKRNHVDDQRI